MLKNVIQLHPHADGENTYDNPIPAQVRAARMTQSDDQEGGQEGKIEGVKYPMVPL